MKDLADQLREACARNERDIHEQAMRMGYDSNEPGKHKAFEYGAYSENARLTPLIEKMILCVEALIRVDEGIFNHSCQMQDHIDGYCAIGKALKALQAEVEKVVKC